MRGAARDMLNRYRLYAIDSLWGKRTRSLGAYGTARAARRAAVRAVSFMHRRLVLDAVIFIDRITDQEIWASARAKEIQRELADYWVCGC